MTFEAIEPLLNYGTPLAILVAVVWGVIKFSKWASGLITNAILAPKTGWLAVINRNAAATENYLAETLERDKVQQQLCEQHANNLQEVTSVLQQHLEISKGIHNDLEQFREDSLKTDTPYSAVEVTKDGKVIKKDVQDIKTAIVEACHGIKDLVQQAKPEVATNVVAICDRVENLLKE